MIYLVRKIGVKKFQVFEQKGSHSSRGSTLELSFKVTLLFLLSVFGEAYAQDTGEQSRTFSGYVKDVTDGEDLIGATIYFPELQDGVITNVYGFYSFSAPPGHYQVLVRYVGYETQTLQIDLTQNQSLNIQLKLAATALEEVVVTGEKSNVETTEMSVEKLDIQTIKQLPVVFGESDILKSIQLLPGVTSVNEGTSGFNVRGGSADQNLVQLDEATVYNTSHLFGLVSVFNTDAIKDVKLYKGGIPAQFGGRTSSVLDIRQREGNTKDFEARGAIGTIFSRLTLEAPFARDEHGEGRGSFLLAGRRSYVDLFSFLSADLSDVSLYFYDFNLKSSYRFSNKDRVFVSGYFGRDVQSIPNLFGNSYGNSTFTVRWNHLFNDRLFSNFTVIRSNFDYSLESRATGTAYLWESSITNWTGKADFSYFLNPKHTVNFGASVIKHEFRPGQVTPLAGSEITPTTLDPKFAIEPAIYLSDEFKLNDRLSFNIGIRYSAFLRTGAETIRQYANGQPSVLNPATGIYENGEVVGETTYSKGEIIKSFGGLEPRFSANYKLNDQNAIKASYNRLYQYIHLISNTTSVTPLDIWSPSGPFKAPQLADQVALGYFTNFKDNTYEFSAEVYYKFQQNQLDYVDGANLAFQNNIETELLSGVSRAYGLELLLKKTSGRFTGWFGYTYSIAERKVDGINNGLYYPANHNKLHDLSVTANYKLSDKWSVASNFVYSSGAPVTYPVARYRYNDLIVAEYDNRNQDRLTPYHRLDFSISRLGKVRKNGNRNKLTFGIYNAYNRLNAASINFKAKTTEVNGIDMVTGDSEATRLSYFGIVPSISYEFKF